MIREQLLEFHTKKLLAAAGWFPGRQQKEMLEDWIISFFNLQEFSLTEAARDALLELGGLRVEQSGAGESVARGSFWFEPTGAWGEYDRFLEFEKFLSSNICPIGEADNGASFLAITEDGRVLCLMDDAWIIGSNLENALNSLAYGRLGKAI